MKPLTFKGYLKAYLTELSLCGSPSVRKLEKEVERNLRLLEPLVLYAKITLDDEQLAKFKNSRVVDALNELNTIGNVENALEHNLLSDNYQKVYNSYKVKTNRLKNEEHTKNLMLPRIREMQAAKHISNYRIYTDLHLNPGNVNDFLTNGNVSKLSLKTAEMIFDYVS